jgi:hypothetical protein
MTSSLFLFFLYIYIIITINPLFYTILFNLYYIIAPHCVLIILFYTKYKIKLFNKILLHWYFMFVFQIYNISYHEYFVFHTDNFISRQPLLWNFLLKSSQGV